MNDRRFGASEYQSSCNMPASRTDVDLMLDDRLFLRVVAKHVHQKHFIASTTAQALHHTPQRHLRNMERQARCAVKRLRRIVGRCGWTATRAVSSQGSGVEASDGLKHVSKRKTGQHRRQRKASCLWGADLARSQQIKDVRHQRPGFHPQCGTSPWRQSPRSRTQ
jgi:hypothetical protein